MYVVCGPVSVSFYAVWKRGSFGVVKTREATAEPDANTVEMLSEGWMLRRTCTRP